MQAEVARVVRRVVSEEHSTGVQVLEEQVLNDGGCYSADIVLRGLPGARGPRRVAIEVDGPLHFLRGPGADVGERGRRHLNGSTRLKQRLLSLLGWDVLSVPYYEWDALGHDLQAQCVYVRSLLSVSLASDEVTPSP